MVIFEAPATRPLLLPHAAAQERDEAAIATLCLNGFSRAEALEALRDSGGDASKASGPGAQLMTLR